MAVDTEQQTPPPVVEQAPEQQPPARTTAMSATPVRDYWQRYHSRAFLLSFLMQLIIAIAITGGLYTSGLVRSPLISVLVGLIILAILTGLSAILLNFLLAPLRDLTAALIHIAGEPTTTTPPNPNASQYQKNGFRHLLQTMYDLTSEEPEKKPSKADRQEALLEKGLSETKAGVAILDHNHKIVYANHAAPTRQNQDGELELEVVFDDEQNTLETWLEQCEASAVHADYLWSRVSNKLVGEEDRRVFNIAASYEKGSVAETVLIFYDLSEQYQPEDDGLDFIAFAAHELRGPITVIRGYLDVFSEELSEKMDAEQRELFKRLVISANRLSGYVNNILNASRYDRRHLQIHLVEERIQDIYAIIADDMQQRATAQNRLLAVNFPSDLPTVAADRSSLSEVFGNLIDNAIKYSNEGGAIAVTARVDGDFVVVSVEDHGIGIPSSVMPNLFHKFYRSHRSRETVAGTGIGLYIVKAITESHGGTVNVKSVEGEGAIFEFSVPIYATVAATLAGTHGENSTLITTGNGWIKNHAMYRG